MKIISFIKEHISWIKDVFTLVLTSTATIIAILTYRRAKATVLQPIRNEVIKKQVEILTEILSFLSSQDFSTKTLYDYTNLVSLNLEIILDNFGLKKLEENKIKAVDEKLKGWVLFLKEDKSSFVYIIGNTEDFNKTQQYIKKTTINIETQIAKLQRLNILFFTDHYYNSYEKISRYSEHPLLPLNILTLLMKIKNDGKFNLLINLEEALIQHIESYIDLRKSNNINYNTETALNRNTHTYFEQKRFQHDDDILLLKAAIRKHLRIDEKW